MASWLLACVLAAPAFQDVTAKAGLEGVRGDRFCFADIDRDGDPDLIVNGRRLFLNEGGRFQEVKGALEGARGNAASCADLDGDGRVDVVTAGGDLFLQEKDGTFRRIDLKWPQRQSAFGIADLNGDGYPDLATSGGEKWKDNRSYLYPRAFYLNEGKGRFVDGTKELGYESSVYGRSVVFCDFDDDGDPDLYLGNYRLIANELLVNDHGTLRDRAKERACSGLAHPYEGKEFFGHTIGASWADLDNDGWMDLWVSNLVHKYVGKVDPKFLSGGYDYRGKICDDSNLFRNLGPPHFRFSDRRADSGIPTKPVGGRDVFRGDELWSNCACADFDNDGDLDVFVTQVYTLPYSSSILFRNEGGFRFQPVDPGFQVFNSYGGAWADIDGDGRLDLVTGGAVGDPKGKRTVRLWANRSPRRAWIAFRLPPSALGAVVRVNAGGKILTRTAEATMGSHAQKNGDALHFGLGDEGIDEIWITWPGGVIQRLAKPPARNKVHLLKSPKAPRRKEPLRLELEKGVLLATPKIRGARYHWDFDDDWRTDQITKTNRIRLPEDSAAPSACVRVLKNGTGTWARCSRIPPSGKDAK